LEDARAARGGKYPDWLIVPYASSHSAERRAFAHWLDELRQKTGKPIRIYFNRDYAPAED
jgi:hypothetical protein